MQHTDLYSNSHLIVAAIRVLEHQKASPPSVENVCATLSCSLEQGNLLCARLNDMGVIEIVTGAFGTRLFVRDHLKLEEIPKDEKTSSLEEAVQRFQNSRKEISSKIESIKAAQAEKQKNLFAELERRLKKKPEKNEGD